MCNVSWKLRCTAVRAMRRVGILRAEAGTGLDPLCVEALEQALDAGEAELPLAA